MQRFKFKAIGKDKNVHSGIILANSQDEAVNSITKIGFTPLKIRRAVIVKLFEDIFDKFSAKDKIFLARNLTIILQSGLGITEGVRILLNGMKNSPLKNFLIHFIVSVEKGMPISQVFSDFPKYFSEIDVEIIRVGEYSGNLASTLKNWAEDLERDKEISNTISSAMIYPIIILVVALIILIVVITFVMPRIAGLVQQMGGKNVPTATRIIIDVSLFLGSHSAAVFGLFFGSLFLFGIFAVSSLGKKFFMKIFIKAPITKNLATVIALRNFCFLAENLLSAGVNLTDSLKLMENTIFHPAFRKTIKSLREKITQGTDFGDAIMGEKSLPGYFSGILGISSRTGTLSTALVVLQDYYEDEVKLRVKNIIAMIEPMLLVGMGIFVGGIALAILIPIYQQISGQLGGE